MSGECCLVQPYGEVPTAGPVVLSALGLIQALMDVALHQKTYLHSPQTKLLEIWSPSWAGWPHLEDQPGPARPLGALAQSACCQA